MTTDNYIAAAKIDGEYLPLKRLMLVGGARSWKYDFLHAFARFPKHRWVKFSHSIGRDEGYFYHHYNEEQFESQHSAYHMRCMENACYTLHELGRTLPDGLVLIQNGMEPLEDEVLATLRIARRAGIDRLCIFLDWYEEMLQDPNFAQMEQQQAGQLRKALEEVGFAGEIPLISGDSSHLLDPPDMCKQPGGNGTDPKAIQSGRVNDGTENSVSRWGAALLDLLDGQYPEQAEAPPAALRLTRLEKMPSPKKLSVEFSLEAGVVRAGTPFYLMLPENAPIPVHIGKLFVGGLSHAPGPEKQEIGEAFYNGRYGPTPYSAVLSLPQTWEEELPAAAWLAKHPHALRERQVIRALIAYPGYEKFSPGARLQEGDAVDVPVEVEGEKIRGRVRFTPADANHLAAGVREAVITLGRPLFLPPKARITLPANGDMGELQGTAWWNGVVADG